MSKPSEQKVGERCELCEGVGEVAKNFGVGNDRIPEIVECPECGGTGLAPDPPTDLRGVEDEGVECDRCGGISDDTEDWYFGPRRADDGLPDSALCPDCQPESGAGEWPELTILRDEDGAIETAAPDDLDPLGEGLETERYVPASRLVEMEAELAKFRRDDVAVDFDLAYGEVLERAEKAEQATERLKEALEAEVEHLRDAATAGEGVAASDLDLQEVTGKHLDAALGSESGEGEDAAERKELAFQAFVAGAEFAGSELEEPERQFEIHWAEQLGHAADAIPAPEGEKGG